MLQEAQRAARTQPPRRGRAGSTGRDHHSGSRSVAETAQTDEAPWELRPLVEIEVTAEKGDGDGRRAMQPGKVVAREGDVYVVQAIEEEPSDASAENCDHRRR